VLIETGFLTCPDELARLMDPDYQAQLAQGIAEGILACR
jgi:N-acetylmuramoyl-L-alanine amidase